MGEGFGAGYSASPGGVLSRLLAATRVAGGTEGTEGVRGEAAEGAEGAEGGEGAEAAEGGEGVGSVEGVGGGEVSSAARLAAFRLVHGVLERNHRLDADLDRAFHALDARARGFARALVGVVLRRLGEIDAALTTGLRRPLARASPAARTGMRLMAAQILFMGVADYAAVNEAVAQARRDPSTRGFVGVVNALGRRLVREAAALRQQSDPRVNLPEWLRGRWRARFGRAGLAGIADAVASPAPLDIALRYPGSEALWARRLGARVLWPGRLRIDAPRSDIALADWQGQGRAWMIQGAASGLATELLLGNEASLKTSLETSFEASLVLDLCAAPGGKTTQLLWRGARVVACDADAARARALKTTLAERGLLQQARVLHADGRTYNQGAFDAVLIDAPCSATGLARRRPDAMRLRQPADIPRLAQLQTELLEAGAQRLKPHGTLIYAVCSLEPEEGRAQVDRFLARHRDWRLDPVLRASLPAAASQLVDGRGMISARPDMLAQQGGIEGFFIARLKRRS